MVNHEPLQSSFSHDFSSSLVAHSDHILPPQDQQVVADPSPDLNGSDKVGVLQDE